MTAVANLILVLPSRVHRTHNDLFQGNQLKVPFGLLRHSPGGSQRKRPNPKCGIPDRITGRTTKNPSTCWLI